MSLSNLPENVTVWGSWASPSLTVTHCHQFRLSC